LKRSFDATTSMMTSKEKKMAIVPNVMPLWMSPCSVSHVTVYQFCRRPQQATNDAPTTGRSRLHLSAALAEPARPKMNATSAKIPI